MAQKRMIDKKISVSEQVANLPTEGQLIFTWSIPHADDLGLLPSSLRTLKAMIVPMLDITLETFGNLVEGIVSQKLYTIFEHDGEKYYRIVKFRDHQTLKKDRKPNTYLKDVEDWDEVESLGFHLEDIGNPSKEKLSKEKLSKENIEVVTKKVYSEFKNVKLTDEEYGKLTDKIGERNTELLIEELGGYLASTNKRYQSHYATLLNWARRKVGELSKGKNTRKIL